MLVAEVKESRDGIDNSRTIIAPSADSTRTGLATPGKSVIRSRALAGDDYVSPRESREPDEAGARKTTGHIRVWVGDAHADYAHTSFVNCERRKRNAVPVGRHDIALRNDIGRQRWGARQRRLQDEPGEHVAIEPVAVLGTKGEDTVKVATGLLNRSLKDIVEAIEQRGGGDASRCAEGPDHVGLGRWHRLVIWFRRNIDTDLLQVTRRADNLVRIVYRDDTHIVGSVLNIARCQQIFGATIGGREALARGRNTRLRDEIVGAIEPNIGEVGAGLEFLFWQDVYRGPDEDVLDDAVYYFEQIGRDEKGVGIVTCLRVVREAIHTAAAR